MICDPQHVRESDLKFTFASPRVFQFHDQETEPVASSHVTIPVHDNKKLTTQKYRELIYEDLKTKSKA